MTQGKTPGIIIQSRVGSTRCPEKCFIKAGGFTLIEHLLKNVLTSKIPVYLAVPENDFTQFQFLSQSYPIILFGGNELDVLDRYFVCASENKIDPIIRVTGDNPFTSVTAIIECVRKQNNENLDLVHPENLPYGTGIEVISYSALKKSHSLSNDPFEREHITQYIYRNKGDFKIGTWVAPKFLQAPDLRLTVDTKEDALRFQEIISYYDRDASKISLEQIISDYTTK